MDSNEGREPWDIVDIKYGVANLGGVTRTCSLVLHVLKKYQMKGIESLLSKADVTNETIKPLFIQVVAVYGAKWHELHLGDQPPDWVIQLSAPESGAWRFE